jgi:hypothetical protein
MTKTQNDTEITVHPIDSTTWTEVAATAMLTAGEWHFRVKVESSLHIRVQAVNLAAPVPVYAVERALSGTFGESAEITEAQRTA